MATYILALKGTDRIHVGEADAFKQHIGRGDGGAFDPALVTGLAAEFELYDELGRVLGVRPVDGGGDVEIVPVVPEKKVAGDDLVARITFILANAQASLNQERARSVERAAAAVGALVDAREGDGGLLGADAEPLFEELPTTIATVRSLAGISPFPIVVAELRVVLAALVEDFGSAVHVGPPHGGDDHHDWLHHEGMTHR
jgi:hypothetical protein